MATIITPITGVLPNDYDSVPQIKIHVDLCKLLTLIRSDARHKSCNYSDQPWKIIRRIITALARDLSARLKISAHGRRIRLARVLLTLVISYISVNTVATFRRIAV